MPFEIIRNDITKVKADIIVNTANPHPVIRDGTDSAIYHAAGERQLLSERKMIGDILPGEAAATHAFALSAKYIIHTVGPIWRGGNSGERDTLHSCYRNSLRLAASLGAESIAFPMIATGVYGFPRDEALQIALSEISQFLLANEMKVTLVVFDRRTVFLSEKLLGEIDSFIDEYGVRQAREAEYGPCYQDEIRRRRQESDRRQTLEESPLRSARNAYLEDEMAPPCMAPKASPREPLQNVKQEQLEKFTDRSLLRNTEIRPSVGSGARDASSRPFPTSAPGMEAEELSAGPNFGAALTGKSLEEILGDTGETFQERLFELIDESGMDDVTVYKTANIDRKLFSRIRCKKDYKPKKRTAVAFAIALRLDMPTMMDLLSRAEIAFSPSNRFDLIITYFVSNGIYDMYEINTALFKYGEPCLGE